MDKLKQRLLRIKTVRYYVEGWKLLNDPYYLEAQQRDQQERQKRPPKSAVLNFLLSLFKEETTYLEIGVRNPDHNFKRIKATTKYSVDPGLEFKANPVNFPHTSDDFFEKLNKNEILSHDIKFDVIFIDGLHLAEQVDRDINNSLDFLKDDGFIVVHDCNPPTEWHARTQFNFRRSPARHSWSGTTWKAFLKWRSNPSVYSCCIDTDWGLGILSKQRKIGKHLQKKIEFYEFGNLDDNRQEYLNLVDFNEFKKIVSFNGTE